MRGRIGQAEGESKCPNVQNVQEQFLVCRSLLHVLMSRFPIQAWFPKKEDFWHTPRFLLKEPLQLTVADDVQNLNSVMDFKCCCCCGDQPISRHNKLIALPCAPLCLVWTRAAQLASLGTKWLPQSLPLPTCPSALCPSHSRVYPSLLKPALSPPRIFCLPHPMCLPPGLFAYHSAPLMDGRTYVICSLIMF